MSTNDPSFTKDFAALKSTVPGNEDVIEAITVGSETLYRGDLTGPQLHNYISAVQKQFPSITVGTADSWNKFADGTADDLFTTDTDANPMVTYVLANAFAYWQGTAVDQAYKTYFDDMSGAMSHIQKIAGSNADKIRIINGETGWPTGESSFPSLRLKDYILTAFQTAALTTRLPRPAPRMRRSTGRPACAACLHGASTCSTSRPTTSRGSPAALVTTARPWTRSTGVCTPPAASPSSTLPAQNKTLTSGNW